MYEPNVQGQNLKNAEIGDADKLCVHTILILNRK